MRYSCVQHKKLDYDIAELILAKSKYKTQGLILQRSSFEDLPEEGSLIWHWEQKSYQT